MFKENKNGGDETETIIGPSVKVEGDFITEGDIVVEGMVCGTIKTAKNLKIGPKSKVYANVSAENALVSGEVQGSMKISQQLQLTSTAKIFGDVKAKILIVASGSILNGKCQMGDSKDKSPKPDFSKQEKIELKTKPQEEPKKKPAAKKIAKK